MDNLKDNNGILERPLDPQYEPDPRGYGAYCFEKMKEFSDRIAQIDADNNKSETYAEILKKSIRVALYMKAIGVQPSTDKISLCTDTHLDTCIPFWAAMFSGTIMANFDPALDTSDMVHLMKQIKPKLIFSNLESVEKLESVIEELNLDTKLVVFGETNRNIPFKDCLESQEGEESFKPKIVNNIFDTLIIIFSSGTTGLAKATCITHYGILYNCKIVIEKADLTTGFNQTSPYWISFIMGLTIILLKGGKKIINKIIDEKNLLQLVENYKITFLVLAPSLAYRVASNVDNISETFDTSSLRLMLTGGSIFSSEQILKLRNIFSHAQIFQIYGMTEISALFSTFHVIKDSEMIEKKPSSSGKMIAGTMCKVIDVETKKVLGKNERGELLIKTNRIMNGYYNNFQKTSEAFDEDGFYYTGDIVYYDEDYCFYVVDRIKEIFKYKSWQIMPAEIERILLNHPAIEEVLVIGYPDEADGDHPMAVIVLADNVNVTQNDIIAYFDEKNSDDRKKLRGGVRFVKSLPKTPIGKYNRVKLRSMIINNEI